MCSIQNFARVFEREFSAFVAVVFFPSGRRRKEKKSTVEGEGKENVSSELLKVWDRVHCHPAFVS